VNDVKHEAIKVLNELHSTIPYSDYCTIMDGLYDIETLLDRDEVLEELWEQFGDIPMNPETERIEEKFMGWGPGIHREEIWHWFDERHSKGVAYLLYGDGFDRTPEPAKLLYLKQLCFECESSSCQFNHSGECRFALIHERKPRINDIDGCIDYDYQEGD
jgi:hypothetical protein